MWVVPFFALALGQAATHVPLRYDDWLIWLPDWRFSTPATLATIQSFITLVLSFLVFTFGSMRARPMRACGHLRALASFRSSPSSTSSCMRCARRARPASSGISARVGAPVVAGSATHTSHLSFSKQAASACVGWRVAFWSDLNRRFQRATRQVDKLTFGALRRSSRW